MGGGALGDAKLGDAGLYAGEVLLDEGLQVFARAAELRVRFQDPRRARDDYQQILDIDAANEAAFRGLTELLADANDFLGITIAINGGTNGLADRQAFLERIEQGGDDDIDLDEILAELEGTKKEEGYEEEDESRAIVNEEAEEDEEIELVFRLPDMADQIGARRALAVEPAQLVGHRMRRPEDGRRPRAERHADQIAWRKLHPRRNAVGISLIERDRHQDVHELGREECRHLGVFAGIGRAPIRSKGVSR